MPWSAFKTALGNNKNSASGTTLVITTTAAIAVGDLVIVRVAADNLTAATPTFTCASSPSIGTFTNLRFQGVNATAGLGCVYCMLGCVATSAAASGSTITLTLSGAVTAKVAYAESFVGVLITTRVAPVGGTGTTTAFQSTASAVGALAGDLALGGGAIETRAAVAAGDADTTSGTWSALQQIPNATSGSDATCVTVVGQYKLITGAGAQTYDFTQPTSGAEWVGGLVILQAAPDPAITQAAYQIFDQGSETGAVSLGALNTAVTGDLTTGDGIGTLRMRLQLTTAVAALASDDWQLQWEKNASGTWTNVVAGSGSVRGYNDASLTDGGATTNRLGAGTGTFVPGKVSETGDTPNFGWTASNFTELVYAITIIKADFADADAIRFRVIRNGGTATMTYTQTPLINVKGLKAGTATATWTETQSATGVAPTPTVPGTRVLESRVQRATEGGVGRKLEGTGSEAIPFSGLVGWWDAALASTITASGGAVSSWGSRSAGAPPAVQSTGTMQPTTGTQTLNARNVLRFDGGDVLNGPTSLFVNPTDGTWTVAAVYREAVYANPAQVFDQDPGSAPRVAQFMRSANGVAQTIGFQSDGTPKVAAASAAIAVGTPVLAVAVAGASLDLYVNGTAVGTSATTGLYQASPKPFTIGWSGQAAYFNGDIAEIVCYSRALTTTERQQVETYLTNKWLTGAAPPSQGSATASWVESSTAVGKEPPKGTATAVWTETQTAVGKEPPKGSATASWSDAQTATGKRVPKTTAPAVWIETQTATGKEAPKATATASWTEAQTATGKRVPKTTATAVDTWAQTATGVAPLIGAKQGSAIATWVESPTATGKLVPKATAPATWTETQSATGKRVPKSAPGAIWTETQTATGKRVAKATAPATWTEVQTATGKRVAKSAPTAAHLWTQTATGVRPVPGVKQGTAAATWVEAPAGVGKRVPKATSPAVWVESSTAVGKRVAKATTSANYVETQTAVGKRAPKTAATAVHLWTLTAVGVRPVVGVPPKLGSAVFVHAWALATTGKRVPKTTSVAAFLYTSAATGVLPVADVSLTSFYFGEESVSMHYGGKAVVAWIMNGVGNPTPFSPASISGLVMWLDASTLPAAPVTVWPDLSGQNHHGTMLGTPVPTVRTNALNGRSVVRFAINEGRVRVNGTGVTTSWTVLYVGRIWSLTYQAGRVLDAIYTPSNLLVGYWNGYEDVAYHEGFTLPDVKVPVTTNWKLYSADGLPTPLTRFFRNDGIGLSTLLGTTTTGAGWYGTFALSGYDPTGMQETCDCEVAEVCMFNRRLTGTERIQVENYMRTKWGL